MDDPVNEWSWEANYLDEEFLRDILQQPEEATAPDAAAVGSSFIGQTSLGSSSSITSRHASEKHASPPSTCILSFEKSTALLPTIHDPSSADWNWVSNGPDSPPFSTSRGTNKTRRTSKSQCQIMSERKRRQEITKKVIALSATIPGLNKMDKAHVLNEAINYVKQLQERVKKLEEDIQKSGVESGINITRSHRCVDKGTTFYETNSDEYYRTNEVEVRVREKEMLIKIHCGKRKGILIKILSQLERLHLSIASSNVLPFGNTLDITIIAQMGDKYSMILKDLVKNLRPVAMLKPCDVQQ